LFCEFKLTVDKMNPLIGIKSLPMNANVQYFIPEDEGAQAGQNQFPFDGLQHCIVFAAS